LTQMRPFWLKMLTKRVTFFSSTVWIYKIVTHMPFFYYPGSELQRLFLAGPMFEFLSFCNQPKPLVFCWSWSLGTVFGLDSCNQGLFYSDHFPPYWPIGFCCWQNHQDSKPASILFVFYLCAAVVVPFV
jgi:hypothetical protein